jgi:DNA-binding XRE family transcriptional regulator
MNSAQWTFVFSRKELPSASEVTLFQHPFTYRIRVEGPTSKRIRRVMLLTALKKLHELFREPNESQIKHEDAARIINDYEYPPELRFREAHKLDSSESRRGFALKIRRHHAKLSLRQLAQLAKVNSAHLCQIEKGRVKPRPGTLKKIEQALLECEAS